LLTQAMQHYEEGWKWQEMPMVGQSIKFGTKTGCDYCAVRSTCWTAEKGAPF